MVIVAQIVRVVNIFFEKNLKSRKNMANFARFIATILQNKQIASSVAEDNSGTTVLYRLWTLFDLINGVLRYRENVVQLIHDGDQPNPSRVCISNSLTVRIQRVEV